MSNTVQESLNKAIEGALKKKANEDTKGVQSVSGHGECPFEGNFRVTKNSEGNKEEYYAYLEILLCIVIARKDNTLDSEEHDFIVELIQDRISDDIKKSRLHWLLDYAENEYLERLIDNSNFSTYDKELLINILKTMSDIIKVDGVISPHEKIYFDKMAKLFDVADDDKVKKMLI